MRIEVDGKEIAVRRLRGTRFIVKAHGLAEFRIPWVQDGTQPGGEPFDHILWALEEGAKKQGTRVSVQELHHLNEDRVYPNSGYLMRIEYTGRLSPLGNLAPTKNSDGHVVFHLHEAECSRMF